MAQLLCLPYELVFCILDYCTIPSIASLLCSCKSIANLFYHSVEEEDASSSNHCRLFIQELYSLVLFLNPSEYSIFQNAQRIPLPSPTFVGQHYKTIYLHYPNHDLGRNPKRFTRHYFELIDQPCQLVASTQQSIKQLLYSCFHYLIIQQHHEFLKFVPDSLRLILLDKELQLIEMYNKEHTFVQTLTEPIICNLQQLDYCQAFSRFSNWDHFFIAPSLLRFFPASTMNKETYQLYLHKGGSFISPFCCEKFQLPKRVIEPFIWKHNIGFSALLLYYEDGRREVVRKAIKESEEALEYALRIYSNEKEIVLEALRCNTNLYLEDVSVELRDDPEIISLCNMTLYDWKMLDEELKQNRSLLLKSLEMNPFLLNLYPESYTNDKEVIEVVGFAMASEELRRDRDFAKKMIRKNGKHFVDVSYLYKSDRELVSIAVETFGDALLKADAELLEDVELVCKALETPNCTAELLVKQVRMNVELWIVLSAHPKNLSWVLQYFPSKLANNFELLQKLYHSKFGYKALECFDATVLPSNIHDL